ncbi:MAG TPA: type II toxin-antitoxin system RelE/ParE family toxin [Humisphaera sp.]
MTEGRPYRIDFTALAERDLDHINEGAAAFGELFATKLLNRILHEIESLGPTPHRQPCDPDPTARCPVRMLPVGDYVVFFRADDEKHVVTILRIRHGARRPLKRFN